MAGVEMMKLAFSTLGCPAWGWERILDQAANLGFDGIEVRGIAGELDNERLEHFWEPNLPSTRNSLKEHKLSISCLDTSCDFLSQGRSLPETIRQGKAAVDIAQSVGAPFIRVFGDRITGMGAKAGISTVAEGMQAVASWAEAKGVTVLLETHGNFAESRLMLAVFELVKSPAAGALWDIANPYEFGETVETTWEAIGRYVRHVHIKDIACRNGGFVPCLPGRGRIPIEEAVQLLKDGRYSGWLSFEWEKHWHPALAEPETALPAFMKYIKRLI